MGVLSKMKDIFGRGGYEVHSPGTFQPAGPGESGLARRARTVYDPAIAAASGENVVEDERHARQHARNSGNYSK